MILCVVLNKIQEKQLDSWVLRTALKEQNLSEYLQLNGIEYWPSVFLSTVGKKTLVMSVQIKCVLSAASRTESKSGFHLNKPHSYVF
jgi:hypothetical protein